MFDFLLESEDSDELKEVMPDLCDQVDFYGNKVLKLENNVDTRWYESLKAINKGLLSFVLKNLKIVAQWNGSEAPAGIEAFFDAS